MIVVTALAGLMLLQGAPAKVPDDYYEINSLYARSCSRAAMAAGQGGGVGGGQTDCTKALDSEPLNALGQAQTLTNRGAIKFATRDRAGALADFDAAIASDPSFAPAYLNRAGVYLAAHDFERARADADKAVRLDGKNARAWFIRGGANEMLGNTGDAYRDFQTAAKLDPNWDQPKAELARFKVGK